MKIVPARLLSITRPALHQLDRNLVIDGIEYTENLAPTGRQVVFPIYANTAISDFDDGKTYAGYNTPNSEMGRMYMEGGSLSCSDKRLVNGQVAPVVLSSALDRIHGYLHQFDSRLPYHFNSVSGLTAGKKYLSTGKGIVEVKPKFKRGLPMGLDVFVHAVYNTLTTGASNAQSQQQIILGESETELFGISWGYYGYFIPTLNTANTGSSSIIWRSTKKIADIDNATAMLFDSAGSGNFDLTYIGKFGDYAIGLRMHAASTTNNMTFSIQMRPASINMKTGVVASCDNAQRAQYPTSTSGLVGNRFAPHNRSVMEVDDIISMYIPLPQTTTDVVLDGVLTGMIVRRYDLNKRTGTWSNANIALNDTANYGDIIAKGNLGSNGSPYCQTLVASWFIEVQGVTHMVVMLLGTALSRGAANDYEENTHQYLYKLNEDKTLTFVSKYIQPKLFDTPNVQAGFAMSKDRKAMYVNTYSALVYRMVFDEAIMAYRHDLKYDVDAWTMHVDDDETLTIIDSGQNLIRMVPTMGTAIRVTFGTVGVYDGQPLFTNLNVAAVNHLGERIATQVKLELDGPLSFTVNALQSLTITTSATEDLAVPVQITGVGDIYCTPVKP